MNKINCNVENCSHNSDRICYSNRINISGEDSACCGSFLNKKNYSTLTNNTYSNGPCDCIICNTTSCTYNNNKLCTADSIEINGINNVQLYTETKCSTFDIK